MPRLESFDRLGKAAADGTDSCGVALVVLSYSWILGGFCELPRESKGGQKSNAGPVSRRN